MYAYFTELERMSNMSNFKDDGSMREKLAEIMDSGELNSSQRQVLQKLMNEMM